MIWSDSQIELERKPMASPPRKRAQSPQVVSQPIPVVARWKLEDAKARLSEVVRRAATKGPQLVTVRGKEAAVILAPEQYRQLLPKPKSHDLCGSESFACHTGFQVWRGSASIKQSANE